MKEGVHRGGISGEVKAEIIAKVKGGAVVLELSKQYGVSYQTIYSWLKQKVEGTVSLLEHTKLKKENEQLKQIVGVLTLELEKTKKNRRELFTLVREKLPHFPRLFVAKVFGFVRSSGYYQPTQNSKDVLLKEQILAVLANHPSYGYGRIALTLGMGKKRVQRAMQLYKIKPYKPHQTTVSLCTQSYLGV